MKLLLKLFLTLIVLSVAVLFFIKTPDGQPVLSADKVLPKKDQVFADITDKTQGFLGKAKDTVSSIKPAANNQQQQNASGVYRWKDENGQWQYSNVKPADQTTESVKNQISISEEFGKKKNYATNNQPQKKADNQQSDGLKITPFTVSPSEIPKLIQDSKNVQNLVDKRDAQLKKAID